MTKKRRVKVGFETRGLFLQQPAVGKSDVSLSCCTGLADARWRVQATVTGGGLNPFDVAS